MKTLTLFFASLLLLAGCVTPPPNQETITEQWQRQDREADARAQAHQAQVDRERASYIAAHAELKPEVRDAIAGHRVIIGMTYEQALKSLGGGHDFHSAIAATGRADEFTYQDMHLVFVNGVLSEIVQ